jgi:immune inhibitor A
MSRRTMGGAPRTCSLAAILLSVILCLTIVLCTTLALLSLRFVEHGTSPRMATPTAQSSSPGARSRSTSTPTGTEALLAKTQIPPLDPYDLARRLKHISELFPQSTFQPHPGNAHGATPLPPIAYSLGDRETFWVLNLDSIESFQVSATLRHISPHLYVWVQDDLSVSRDGLERSTQTFEGRLYPIIRRYFGSEWSPGIDGDARLTVFNARFSGALGYFSTSDEYPVHVMPFSNQREMFYINPEYQEPGSASYDSTLAHEFQHMVHWFADSNEDAWVNEGASELAMHLCGYPRRERIYAFSRNPDTQLTSWDLTGNSGAEHYGAAFLFLAYFAERFGPQMTRDLVTDARNGTAGFESVLQAHNVDLSFEDLFADWVIANYLDGETGSAPSTPYTYQELDVQAQAERVVSSYPVEGDGTVRQYAADYIELEPSGADVRMTFTGAPTTKLVPNQPHSGRYQWWSNRGDNSDMTLTRPFDLSGLAEATLEAWLWYDIEDGWDYAYAEASSDDGMTWHILQGKYTTTDNPSGNSYGPGYTGVSCGEDDTSGNAKWIHETFDLSPFAGHQVLIRFEYLTDEALNRPGLCVDDISIPELGYSYDVENSDDGWVAQGFVRSDNILPQRYVVQLIRIAAPNGRRDTLAEGQVTIERLILSEEQSGSLTIDHFDQSVKKAVLVISAATPGSTEAAKYHYEIHPAK